MKDVDGSRIKCVQREAATKRFALERAESKRVANQTGKT